MPDVFYVYAIVRSGTPLPSAIAGARRSALVTVTFRDLAAVVARKRGDSDSVTIEAMLNHEAIVEAIRLRGPALPVRFGTTFRDRSALVSALAEQYEGLVLDLRHVGDKVEMSLTALWAPSAMPVEGTLSPVESVTFAAHSDGARYLRARAADLRHGDELALRARAIARKIDHLLGRYSLDRRVSVLPTPRIALRTAYLMNPEHAEAFRSVFDSVRRTRREVRLLLTGPWPPYSFVRRADGAGAGVERRLTDLARLITRDDPDTQRLSGRAPIDT